MIPLPFINLDFLMQNFLHNLAAFRNHADTHRPPGATSLPHNAQNMFFISKSVQPPRFSLTLSHDCTACGNIFDASAQT